MESKESARRQVGLETQAQVRSPREDGHGEEEGGLTSAHAGQKGT